MTDTATPDEAAAGIAAETGPDVMSRPVALPVPDGPPLDTGFSVEARAPGGDRRPVPVLRARTRTVDERTGTGVIRDTSVAGVDFTAAVETEVTSSGGALGSARIRPLSYGIPHVVDGATVGRLRASAPPAQVSFGGATEARAVTCVSRSRCSSGASGDRVRAVRTARRPSSS